MGDEHHGCHDYLYHNGCHRRRGDAVHGEADRTAQEQNAHHQGHRKKPRRVPPQQADDDQQSARDEQSADVAADRVVPVDTSRSEVQHVEHPVGDEHGPQSHPEERQTARHDDDTKPSRQASIPIESSHIASFL